ncbi:hypothetical protein [Loktanella salsilacus]|uniref:hypothetical protein n=1 Tax=Loktanella salsilacus TaxID=195913 RepID=UPI003735C325
MASILIDMLRSAHLLFFAAGMGTSLYYDFRTFQTLHDPIDKIEIQGLMRIHTWVSLTFGCLWVSGIALIYIRTAFDLAAFSPKLWLKVGIMTLMVWNAQKIGRKIIPLLKDNVGTPMIGLPTPQLLGATQLAVNSMFCWTAGLILGSSVAVKTAPWETLIIVSIGWFALLTITAQTTVFLMNIRNQRAQIAEDLSTSAISR